MKSLTLLAWTVALFFGWRRAEAAGVTSSFDGWHYEDFLKYSGEGRATMGQLIGLVFEAVPVGALEPFVAELLSTEPPFDLSASEFEMEAGANLADCISVFSSAQPPSPGMLSLRANRLLIGEASIFQPLVQLICAEGVIDALIVFEWEDTTSASGQTAISLRLGAERLALKHAARSFACGYEPVSDGATLIFSGRMEGPLWDAYASR